MSKKQNKKDKKGKTAKARKACQAIPLKDIVPSKNMRKYFKKVGFAFEDRDCASIIWNHEVHSRSKKLKLLKILHDTTKDKVLKREIKERLNYEHDTEKSFKKNDGSCVYVITKSWHSLAKKWQS